jgi:hypothetical protein
MHVTFILANQRPCLPSWDGASWLSTLYLTPTKHHRLDPPWWLHPSITSSFNLHELDMDIQAMPSEAVHEKGLDLPKEFSWAADPREERGHLARDVLDANSLETGTEEEVSQVILGDDVLQALDLALLGTDRISALERNHLPLAEAGRRQPCRMEGEGELRQQGELAREHEERVMLAIVRHAREPVHLWEDDTGDVMECPRQGWRSEHGSSEVQVRSRRDDEREEAEARENDLVPLAWVVGTGNNAVEERWARRICIHDRALGSHEDRGGA